MNSDKQHYSETAACSACGKRRKCYFARYQFLSEMGSFYCRECGEKAVGSISEYEKRLAEKASAK